MVFMKTIVTSLRLPSKLHKKLTQISKEQVRSLNQQIVCFLEAAVEQTEKAKKQPPR